MEYFPHITTPKGLTNPVDRIEFNTSYTPTGTEPIGTQYWNPTEGGLDYVIDQYGSITIGAEDWDILHNLSGGQLVNGNIVSGVGVSGNRTAMAKTDASNQTSATACLGMVTVPTINNNQPGRITKRGKVRGLNTLGLTEGMPVYVDCTTPGNYTQTLPSANCYFIHVGLVLVAHATEGIIDVDIRVSPSLQDLSLVNGTALIADGQIPSWHNASGFFDFDKNINNYLLSSTASSTYVPYTGATSAVNLGSQNLTTLGTSSLDRIQTADTVASSSRSYAFGKLNKLDASTTSNITASALGSLAGGYVSDYFYSGWLSSSIRATGLGSFAWGYANAEAGQVSVNILASGKGSVAFNGTATSDYTFAINGNATALNSFAFGGTASGISSVSMGSGSSAGNNNSIAMGTSSRSFGADSTAVGSQANAVGSSTTAIGLLTYARGQYSVAIGHQAISSEASMVAMGRKLYVQDITSLGAEKITNGTFTGSATGWTLGTGWAYSTNQARKSSDGTGTLSQASASMVTPLVVGEMYYLTMSVLSFSTGTFTVSCGGVTFNTRTTADPTTYSEVFIATSTAALTITPSNTSRFYIDNVSLKKVTGGSITAPSSISTSLLVPMVDDTGTLGQATKSWSDLFLASGAVVNFANGNYTLTHASGTLSASGTFGATKILTPEIKTDTTTPTDLTVTTGSAKTLVLTTPVWDDINYPITIRTTGVGIPTLTTFNGRLTKPQWAVNDFNMCESNEFPHSWKEGSQCYWHIHLDTNGLDATNRYVNFELEYAYSVNGVWTFPAVVTTGDLLIPANTPDKTQIIFSLANFTPTGAKIGDHCVVFLKRIASTGTAPTNNPWISMVQLHTQRDTLGSRNIGTK